METKTAKKDLMEVLVSLYDYHTKQFYNVIEGISDKDAGNRLGTKANHVAWLVGSLVYGRYSLAKALGKDVKQTSEELFRDYKGIQDDVTYPPLAEFKADWDKISPVLNEAYLQLTDEQLNAPDPFEMPGDFKLFDSIMFMVDRESYVIGQIGLYRRLLGYEAMKYV